MMVPRNRWLRMENWIALVIATVFLSGPPAAVASDGLIPVQRHPRPASERPVRLKTPLGTEIFLVFGDSRSIYETDRANALPRSHPPENESPDTLALLGLLIKEFDVFKGLKNLTEDVEGRLDRCIERMNLRGEINFSRDSSRQWRVRENFRFDGNMMVRMKDTSGAHHWFPGVPSRIAWKFHSNFSDKYLIGEVNIGRYLSLEGSLGSDTGCLFRLDFMF